MCIYIITIYIYIYIYYNDLLPQAVLLFYFKLCTNWPGLQKTTVIRTECLIIFKTKLFSIWQDFCYLRV